MVDNVMLKSMTGFGRGEVFDSQRKITVEIKSVNHRYLDINIRMPKKLNFFEASIRSTLKKYIQRGKVDLYISYEDFTENVLSLKYNKELAAEYMGYFKEIEEQFQITNDIRVSSFVRLPEVFTMEEQTVDEETLWNLLEEALVLACKKFVETRELEGESLKNDMLDKLENMSDHVSYIVERYPILVSEYRARIENKVKELLAGNQIDDSRIATEVVMYADKISVDEEIVRLKSHIESVKITLKEEDNNVGRKLDFIVQEMNREANTILSKSGDLGVTNHAIELKTEIEKVREQIQNIE